MPFGRSSIAITAAAAIAMAVITPSNATADSLADPATNGGTDITQTAPDALSADDELTASAIAVAHDHAVTVDSSTTPTQLLSAEPDGTFTMKQDSVPVRVQADDGWEPIDTSLRRVDSAWLAPAATVTPVQFSLGGSETLARVQTDTGAWVTESWPAGGSLPEPTVDGAAATYADVLPDVDLRLTATATGMAEVLIVKSSAAAAAQELQAVELQMHGATLEGTRTHTTASATDGSTLRSANPTWWDARGEGNESGPDYDTSPHPVDHSSTEHTVTLDVAAAANEVDQYPLYVDPDWTQGQQAYWFDDAAYPNQSYMNGQASAGYQSVGWAQKNGATYMSRAFWQFNTARLQGKHILSAHFNTIADYSCGNPNVQAWRYGVVAPGQTWTWDQGHQGSWAELLDTSSVPSVANCAMTPKAFGWNVAAGVDATVGGVFQIGLRSEVENGWSRKHFTPNASLTINYNSVPATPTGVRMSSPMRACGTSWSDPAWLNNHVQPIVLSVKASDSDGGNLTTIFQAVPSSDTDAPLKAYYSEETLGGTQTVELPKDYLPRTGKWLIHARTSDGTDRSDWSPWCYVYNLSTPPAAPTVVVPDAERTIGKSTTFTVHHDSTSVRGFEYWTTHDRSKTGGTAVKSAVSTSTGYADCSFADGIATYTCVNDDGDATARLAPVSATSTLWVKAIDRAGNVSAAASPTGDGTGWDFDAQEDPQVGTGPSTSSHIWSGTGASTLTGDGTSSSPNVISDAAAEGRTGRAAAQPLAIAPGVSTTTEGTEGLHLGTPALSFKDLVRVNRYYGGVSHSATSAAAPSGMAFQATVGMVQDPGVIPGQDMQRLFVCDTGSGDKTAGSCGSAPAKLLGYSWLHKEDLPAGATPVYIYRCIRTNDYFLSADPGCEGYTQDNGIGYFAAIGSTHTTTAPVDTTKSYTVSAWLKASKVAVESSTPVASGPTQTAISLDGQNSPFYLQWSGSAYRFCVKALTDNPSTNCAQLPDSPAGRWAYVTGTWDSVNHQVRISLNSSQSAAATAAHNLGEGESPANGGVRIGDSMTNGSPISVWKGEIADVSIIQGLPSDLQLLRAQNINELDP
ncbi:LamG domain-containing protein [Curtobacterium flaccumfaciens pv. flaccumfaciens]|uniref:LamG domain-containing protein n=1 Tax=Curtobacterium flaccumfaciens TaxID=2035 RepID=UPI00217CD174|nr:LamG domain-containing protein [Curtobacterium flaccumfaciens]MCS6569255.1 LamG domain-containing protein [Curtobacterium flaccumfaciens pv. flaccumfaciens]MCS6584359.1 LamG domain-containing protein [Curtobacterium flaccumfaciens pv. flaccumfaciens]